MRRSAYLATMTLAVVLLAAGSPASHNGAGSASTPPSDPPTPSPTTVAPDPADPTSWVISDAGIGPFEIGMPFADAVAIIPGAEEACPQAYFGQVGADATAAIWITGVGGLLDHVSLNADGPRTAEGIGIGSTVEEVRAAYPDAVEVERNLAYLQVGQMFFGYRDSEPILDVGVSRSGPVYEFCG